MFFCFQLGSTWWINASLHLTALQKRRLVFARLLFAEFFSMVGGLLTSYWFRQNFIQSKEIYNAMNVRSSTSLKLSYSSLPSLTFITLNESSENRDFNAFTWHFYRSSDQLTCFSIRLKNNGSEKNKNTNAPKTITWYGVFLLTMFRSVSTGDQRTLTMAVSLVSRDNFHDCCPE